MTDIPHVWIAVVTKPCPCGSGQQRRDLIDAAGIFCCFVCDTCETEKRSRYRPAIFKTPNYDQEDN